MISLVVDVSRLGEGLAVGSSLGSKTGLAWQKCLLSSSVCGSLNMLGMHIFLVVLKRISGWDHTSDRPSHCALAESVQGSIAYSE